MKKISVLFLVLVMSLSAVLTVSAAAPAPGGPFSTAFYVQNLEATSASCTYSFYSSTGTVVLTSAPFTIAGGANVEVYTPSIDGLPDGSYSGVVSCDKQVAAIVNFSDSNSGASHSGISEAGLVWYAPNVYDNYYTYYSNVYVQNTTSATVDITLELYAPGSSTPAYTNTKTAVPAYASVVWEQEGLTELSDNVSYSAKVTGTGNVAPVVNIYGGEQLYSYNPFVVGSTSVYVPMLYHGYYGFNTELKIQNIAASIATVQITYSNGQTTNVTIPPSSGQSFYTPSVLPLAGTVSYSAVVTSDQPIVVVVNESSPATGFASTYTGLDGGAVEVSLPVLYNGYYTFNTEVVCQNIGAVATDITITYNGTGAAVAPTRTVTGVLAGKTTSFYTPSDAPLGLPSSYKGSGYATSSGGVEIACVVNEGSLDTSKIWDAQYSYNGILK